MNAPSKLSDQQVAEKVAAIMYAADVCAQTLAMRVDDSGPGYSVVSMVVDAAYANGHGFCQGGIITTLADTAFAYACNSRNVMSVAQGLSIEFVRCAKVGERLTATATEQSQGRLTGVYQVLITNPEQKTVAIFTGKSFSREQPVFTE